MVLRNQFPKIYTPYRMPDFRHLGVFLMTKAIPRMFEEQETGFIWHYDSEDVKAFTPHTVAFAQKRMRDAGYKCDKGDTTWTYQFKAKNGSTVDCEMTTEIWYPEDEDYRLSPLAVLFGQFFGNGEHITHIRFTETMD